uniref:Uncharacterized protein n=1 Tax=Cucumis melo TaxID=3656 RepID=A0A9I9EG57_CUCME
MDLKGQILDEETKEVVNLKTTNAFGEEDILTRALGGKDHPGILRGVGKYVTKKKYFHKRKSTSIPQHNKKQMKKRMRRPLLKNMIKWQKE